MRFGTRKSFQVKLTEAPSDEQMAANDVNSEKPNGGISAEKLGIEVEPVSDEMAHEANIPDADRGVRVTDVAPAGSGPRQTAPRTTSSSAVLYPEPRHDVHSVADLQAAVSKVKSGDYVSLLVYAVTGQGQTGTTRVVSPRGVDEVVGAGDQPLRMDRQQHW